MLIKSRRSNVPIKHSILSALQFFGVDDYQRNNAKSARYYIGYRSFWARHEDDLDAFVHDVRKAIRTRIKETRTDMTENHEQAVQIVEVYQWLKKQFARKGVRL